ncbi:MAG: hypothetical protein J6N49_00715 [Alphaproteobacteria bacterium]|nr:hypothetical protein [Alphaproteobacteria bacterium]
MLKFVMLLVSMLFIMPCDTQAYDNQIKDNPVVKTMRGSLRNSGDDKIARNLLVVKEVADFKIGDEKYAKNFETVENTRAFDRKMEKIMEKLSNNKRRNMKNDEVVKILNEAGEKIYNLLGN